MHYFVSLDGGADNVFLVSESRTRISQGKRASSAAKKEENEMNRWHQKSNRFRPLSFFHSPCFEKRTDLRRLGVQRVRGRGRQAAAVVHRRNRELLSRRKHRESFSFFRSSSPERASKRGGKTKKISARSLESFFSPPFSLFSLFLCSALSLTRALSLSLSRSRGNLHRERDARSVVTARALLSRLGKEKGALR